MHKIFNPQLITIWLLGINLSVTPLVLTAYQPPADQKPPSGYSDSSGVR
ncbi:hypothetical protein B6N60_00652 [Richelia sinica FACHB-800]|uniref:Uncharacterized protein n=1 Tax=Richelia sinica FACHB-800 TaxID=1357546 RepID=A0A975Y3B8_9NOST|nr:hypothetical protein B6N60_00652 [Richelia sinica FACHB-800]